MRIANLSGIALHALAVLLISGCGDGTGPAPGPVATAAITVADNRFTPPANAVAPGETVTWTWTGAAPHNVTFDDASVGNSMTQTEGSFSKAFATAGEYSYFCTVHGRALMSGRVIVQSPTSSGPGS